jgi:hypothetical protein
VAKSGKSYLECRCRRGASFGTLPTVCRQVTRQWMCCKAKMEW